MFTIVCTDCCVGSIVWILSRFLGDLPPLKVVDPVTDEPMPELQDEEQVRSSLRAPKYSGAILADSMGLGKTLSCIACLELMARHKLNVVREQGPFPRRSHRPMLVLAPNATVAAQWIEEICLSTDPETIVKIITSGNGLQFRKHHSSRVRALNSEEFSGEWPDDVNYVWDDRDQRASKTIIVMSIDTFSKRTVEVTYNAMGRPSYTSTFTEMGRQFSVVVVDEAHKVKNDTTRNWKSVLTLDRQFTLLVTATPAINSLTDLMGLARLLWPAPSEYLKIHKPQTWQRMENTVGRLQDLRRIDGLAQWDDMRLVAGRPGLLAKILCRNRGAAHDIQLVRDYLKYFESLAILRRSPSSSLYMDWEKTRTVSLEGLLPKVDHTTIELELDPKLAKIYQTVHATLLGDYVKVVNAFAATSDSAKKSRSINSITVTHRLLQIASASVGVYQLDDLLSKNGFGTNATHITVMRRARVTLKSLIQFMLEPYDPRPETALSVLKIVVRYSPVLRYILHDIQQNILAEEVKAKEEGREDFKIKKLLITEASPILAYFYELVLQFLGFNCRTFHADLSQEARKELADNFNSEDENSCQILIQMYTVGFAGANLHRSCSRVLVASQASSLPVQWQAVHRVIRVGQMSDVEVTRVKVRNSHHAFRESRQIEKLMPELGARAQGGMNDILVGILNLFQYEVDAAWESPEAQRLVQEMNLLLDKHSSTQNANNSGEQSGSSGPAAKQRKLDNGSSLAVNGQSEGLGSEDEEDGAEDDEADTVAPTPPPQPNRDAKSGAAGWLCQDPEEEAPDSLAAFLTLKTRNEYYAEFKKLPRVAKSYFSHEKNNLRRVLSFGNVSDGNKTPRVWRVDDLLHPAVLERAIELMLRVRLGAGPIEMLPLPQIDFSLADEDHRKVLQKLLAKVTQTDQDVEAAREQLEGSGRRVVKETLPDGLSMEASINQIEDALEQDARHGGITAAQMQRVSTRVNYREQDEDQDEDDGEAEGEGGVVEMLDIADTNVEIKEEKDADYRPAKGNRPELPRKSTASKEKVIIVIDDDDDEVESTPARRYQPLRRSITERAQKSSEPHNQSKDEVDI